MYKPIDSDVFLSEEDLDLANLIWDELMQVWDDWLTQAQSTNAEDEDLYSHSAFMLPSEYKKYLHS